MEFNAEMIMKRARTKLVLDQPFFGTLALYLQVEENAQITSTMATDGKRLVYNPTWVEKVHKVEGFEVIKGAVSHEVLHCALDHILRCGSRDQTYWNYATDYAINIILKDAKLELPKGVLINEKYRGLSADEIYAKLQKEKPPKMSQHCGNGGQGQGQDQNRGQGGQDQQGQDGGQGSQKGQRNGQGKGQQKAHTQGGAGGLQKEAGDNGEPMQGQPWGDHSIWRQAQENTTSAEIERQAAEWKKRLVQAMEGAKMRDNVPAGMERLVREMLEPKVDWRRVLAYFLQPSKVDYTWSPPDRRFCNGEYGDIIMPDFGDEAVEDIWIVVDTSGSVGDKELAAFLAEVRGIMASYPQVKGFLAFCDAKLHGIYEVNSQDPWPERAKPKGGGGTDFRPVFEEIRKRAITPSALAYITDGYGRFPEVDPGFPVLWVITTNVEAPWGQTVRLEGVA